MFQYVRNKIVRLDQEANTLGTRTGIETLNGEWTVAKAREYPRLVQKRAESLRSKQFLIKRI